MRLIVLFVAVMLSVPSVAQVFTGKIVDSKNLPITFANVIALKTSDNSLVTGVVSNEEGYFSINIKNKECYLKVSFVGYTTKKIMLTDTNLKTIVLEEENVLEEVVVTSRKKMIEQKVDRLVFNVENSIASQGLNGVDLLKKTPLLNFDETQGLSIIGKGNVSVMINGRMLNLKGRELNNYLQSIQSDNIKKVEVITTPPSKYDAQGNSGLINIVLKNNSNLGWSGSVRATYQRNSVDGVQSGATLNYQKNKINTSLKLSQYDIGFIPEGTNDFLSNSDNILSSSNRGDDLYGYGLDYSMNYTVNKKSDIGVVYNFGKSNYDMDSFYESNYRSQSQLDSVLTTSSIEKSKSPKHTLGVYYDLKLDTIGKKMNIEANYYGSNSERVSDFNTDVDGVLSDIVRNSSDMDYNIYSGKIDFILPYKWGNIETGTKYTLFKNNSDVAYFNNVGGDYILDINRSNVFKYDESNFALYGSFQKEINKKWSYKIGSRFEYTALEGVSTEANKVSDTYGRLFPSLYVGYKVNTNSFYSISYSRRIDRPSFRDLNPFRWYTNPYRYFTGNPNLQPSLNDNVELSFSFKNKWTFKLYNEYGKENTSNIDRFEDGIYSNVVENAYDDNKTGLTVSYYDTFYKIWEMSSTINANYVKTFPNVPELESLSTFSTFLSLNNSIALNSKKTVFFNLNFWYSSPRVIGNITLNEMYELSPGLRASFLDKKLTMSLVVSDLLRSIQNNGTYAYTGYQTNFQQYNDHRKVAFSISYSFGNNKVKGAQKNMSFGEKNRAY